MRAGALWVYGCFINNGLPQTFWWHVASFPTRLNLIGHHSLTHPQRGLSDFYIFWDLDMSASLKDFHLVTVTIQDEVSKLTGLKCLLALRLLGWWVNQSENGKWNFVTLPPWLQRIAMGLLLMRLATISSRSRNSCTMLMLSRCSKRIKSCDNSIGKLGAIMENAESASRLTVTWSSQTTLVWASLRVWDKPQSWFGCSEESLSPFWQWWHICYFV